MLKPMCAMMVAASLLAVSFESSAVVLTTGGGSSSSSSSSGPNCSGAAASNGVIWPPDHSMVPETIVGVTDPYDQQLTIAVTGIQQDEPVLADGSGNTQPDGSGVGTSTAYVRAERSGPGTGRIYFITFTATDPEGAQCTNTVRVYVPHDQGQGYTPTDTNERFDSTVVTTS